MPTSDPQTRFFYPTPGRFVLAVLAIEVLLWLSDRFGWLGWHKGYAVLTAVASVGVAMLLMLLWFGTAVVMRWRFQFSIRSLLMLALAVALPFSWLAMEMRKAKEQKEAAVWVEMVKGWIEYDYESTNVVTPGPNWLRSLVGKDLLSDVVSADLAHQYESWNGGESAQWGNLDVTDAGLEHLNGFSRLEELQLDNTQITDAGLEHVGNLTQLRTLSLVNSEVTAAGVAKLQQALPNCKISR